MAVVHWAANLDNDDLPLFHSKVASLKVFENPLISLSKNGGLLALDLISPKRILARFGISSLNIKALIVG
jgi:hypothetical protein